MAGKKRKRRPTNLPRGQSVPSARPPHNVTPTVSSTGQSNENERNAPPVEQQNLILQALLQQYTTNQHQSGVREQERDVRDRTRLCVEKIALGVGFLGLIGLLITLFLTRQSVDVAVENIRLDQRAWVGVAGMKLARSAKVGEELEFLVDLRNSGKTPALGVIMGGRTGTPEPMTLKDFAPSTPPIGSVVVPPDVGFQFSIYSSKEGMTVQNAAAINDGIIPVHVYGTITYRDVFGYPRWTRFCAVYRHNKSFPTIPQFCRKEGYNDMK